MTWQTTLDLTRGIFAAAAFLLAALILRLTYLRYQRGAYGPNPDGYLPIVSRWTTVSYVLMLLVSSAVQVSNLGKPPQFVLPVVWVAIVCGWVGVLRRARITIPGSVGAGQ